MLELDDERVLVDGLEESRPETTVDAEGGIDNLGSEGVELSRWLLERRVMLHETLFDRRVSALPRADVVPSGDTCIAARNSLMRRFTTVYERLRWSGGCCDHDA